MKTILVLTNFSKSARHATESAVWLAEKLHTSLLLWSCYPKVPVMPGYAGGTLVAETVAGTAEGPDKLHQLTRELEDFMTNTGGDYKPNLTTRYREGGFQEELYQQLDEEPYEMIITGGAADRAFEHIFTGSDTFKVIETANCPVLIVPHKAALNQLDKVVFATDFELEDLQAIQYLDDLSHTLDFRIEIVHVNVNGEKDQAMVAKQTAFTTQLAMLQSPGISYQEIRGKDVVSSLNRISKQAGADMLAMTHHQYSFIKSLFTDSTTKKELTHQQIPLLVFPLNYNR
jgi:nucleotide-binding universal stress UspA family protein